MTGACVDRSRLCDGVADCDDGSDELMPQCDNDDVNEIIGGYEPSTGGSGDSRHGCQMATAGFLESYVFGPSGVWTMAPLRCAAKFDPFLSLDCARVEGVGAQSKERKGSNFAA